MNKAIKILIFLIEGFLLTVFVEDQINFYFHSTDYYIGSDAMVGEGGWPYQSHFNYILSGLVCICFSILLLFLAFRSNKIKFLLFILLLVICKIVCMRLGIF